MIIAKRFALIILAALLPVIAFGAETKKADPRTMAFAPLVFEVPKTERIVLKNGMVVHMLPDRELPLVSLTAYVNVGSIYEPADKTGLAGLTGAVMRSGGTRELPPQSLDAELEFMASAVESSIGADAGSVSLSCLKRNLPRTLELFAQVMMAPAFSEDRVALAKKRTIEALRRQNDDSKEIADREFQKAVYPNHPLGRVPTIETVTAITRDDMVAFQKQYFHPNNVILAVSGDFDTKEMVALLEKTFAGWQREEIACPPVPEPAKEVKPVVLLARKDVPQSAIRMGHPGIDKNNPDLYAVRVMDYILGGGFTSRLMTEIRSNEGLAYNVHASFDIGRRFIGTFEAETETKSETTAKAIGLMRAIIAGMTKEPVTDAELALAKDAIVNSFIFGFARTDAVVAQRARIEFYGYPEGYLENYRANIAKVSKDDVLRVARRCLKPERMVTVVVGDDKTFDKPLSTFGTVEEIKLDNGTEKGAK
ncbi:insulinase family protein [Geobacter hydrogenophilus]|uniref:Peptidase M16 n=1 Tax=Geobacter hydrogenophilus TaxID=40983 RepID=A0A9W6LDH1_9BACT|nr:pitrilysin family protein [Geobacter hydrogenophilus]MBT0892472.1 insulinase family protein [Geobacter hydrogenophilus]GLI39867.1 peptidase M16 [Geobacter hydrogenophilus]